MMMLEEFDEVTACLTPLRAQGFRYGQHSDKRRSRRTSAGKMEGGLLHQVLEMQLPFWDTVGRA